MYTDYYGFSEYPFSITPDPRFLYLTEGHVEALASLFYGIREKKGFICITGEVGTGKTTVIYHLIDRLPDWVKTAFVYHTSTTFDQLLKNILLELKIPVDSNEKYLLVHKLNTYLLERLAQDETVTLFIDEAQNLPVETLEELRMLTNLETRRAKLLQIVLVGQPELDAKIDSAELRQLKQRIVLRRRITAMSREESTEYIDHRLRIVGGSSSQVFTPDAVSLICSHAEGIPRLINVICDNALMMAYGQSRKKIGDDVIREVIRDMNGHGTRRDALVAQPAPLIPPALPPSPRRGLDSLHRLLAAVTSRRNGRGKIALRARKTVAPGTRFAGRCD